MSEKYILTDPLPCSWGENTPSRRAVYVLVYFCCAPTRTLSGNHRAPTRTIAVVTFITRKHAIPGHASHRGVFLDLHTQRYMLIYMPTPRREPKDSIGQSMVLFPCLHRLLPDPFNVVPTYTVYTIYVSTDGEGL